MHRPPRSPLFPYTTLFRSRHVLLHVHPRGEIPVCMHAARRRGDGRRDHRRSAVAAKVDMHTGIDRKSTRLNSSHVKISYAVFCLKKKKKIRAPRVRIDATR